MQKTNSGSREKILAQLKAARPGPTQVRPALPPAPELALDEPALTQHFLEQLQLQGGIAYRVSGDEMLQSRLAEICRQEGVTHAMVAEDDVTDTLKLKDWGAQRRIAVASPSDYADRSAYTRAAFDEVQAGITGADYAVAESGSLVIVHHTRQARLISLAPLIHIAIVPLTRMVPTYEAAMSAIFSGRQRPSQVTWITGPSMTADIQATPFKGMHGPQKLFVLLTSD